MRDVHGEIEFFGSLAAHIAELETDLRTADLQDPTVFEGLMLRAQAYLDLEQKAIAELFDTSQATVSRWLSGTHVPYPAVRRRIYVELRMKACEKLKRLLQIQETIQATRSPREVNPA